MNILISNDDGIRAEGIARLAAAALPFGRVYVAAPQSQCSGMSQKLTIRGTLAVEQADFPVPVEAAWAVGAPRPTASRQLSRPSSPAGRTWC